jgi:hypothetical protein
MPYHEPSSEDGVVYACVQASAAALSSGKAVWQSLILIATANEPRQSAECPICFEELKAVSKVSSAAAAAAAAPAQQPTSSVSRVDLPCGHGFHRDCVSVRAVTDGLTHSRMAWLIHVLSSHSFLRVCEGVARPLPDL